jgi:hypothetical protein
MSLADELNKIAKFGYIKFDELNVGQKYKVYALKSYDSNLSGKPRKGVRVDIDTGYLLLPECFDQKVPTLGTANIENLYIVYNGRTKENRLEIHFSEEKSA